MRDGAPRSRNRPPSGGVDSQPPIRHNVSRTSRRKVKRSAVEIASGTFSEIRRVYAGEFEVREERRLRVRSVPGRSTPASSLPAVGGRNGAERDPRPFSFLPAPRSAAPISSSQIRNKLLRGVVGSRRFFLSPRREGAFTVVGGWPSSDNPLPPKNWLSGSRSRIPRRAPLAFSAGRLSLTIKVRPP